MLFRLSHLSRCPTVRDTWDRWDSTGSSAGLGYMGSACRMAVPVAWFIIRRWVSSFPYQSPVPVWIFLVALVLVSLITAVTVTLQSRRAALRNPVDSISSE